MKFLKVLIAVLLLNVSTVWADLFEDGTAAYKNGDYVNALRIFQSLAMQGHAEAQFNLGFMYINGRAVVQNDVEAIKWFRLAAAQGIASAQKALGLAYSNGQGIAQDYVKAVEWFQLAAGQHYAIAVFNLGIMYENGLGVTQDLVHAYMLFTIGAVSGYLDAVKKLDKVPKQMTPQQTAQAQKMAIKCQQLNYKECF